MDVDIILEPDLTPAQITELGLAAETYGIRGLWTSNFFAHYDCFLSLADLARESKRIHMGPLAVSPFEMHPMKIANSLLTLNEMTGGRTHIAVGAGEGNLDAYDIKKPKKVVLAVREAIEIIRAAASGGLTENGYKGEIFNVTYPCAMDYVTAPPPRVYAACYRHMMMRMGGRVADGVFIGCTPTEIIEPAIENIQIGVSKRAEPVEKFPINSFWAWHIKEDREAAYRESRRELPWRARKLDPDLVKVFVGEEKAQFVADHFQDYVDMYFADNDEVKGVPKELSNELCEALTSTGGIEDLDREIERFKKFGEAGQTELGLRLHGDPMEGLKIIGEHVVPALRDV